MRNGLFIVHMVQWKLRARRLRCSPIFTDLLDVFLVFTLRKISGSLDDELLHKFLHSLLQLVFLFLFHLPSGHPCVLVETVCRV